MRSMNKYLPFVIIYFFLNSIGLPFGLTYMVLLAPFFYWWILVTRKKDVLLPMLLFLFPFVFVQMNFIGVDDKSYLISIFNLVAVYIFCQAVYTFLKHSKHTEKLFRIILITNFILCLIAIPFYFSSYADVFWINQELTKGIEDFKRLKLFTYEASYYATLFVPLFFFFFVQVVLKQNKINAWLAFLLIGLPLVLSFSLGVLSAILLSTFFVFAFHFLKLIRKKRVLNLAVLITTIVIPVIIFTLIYLPHNTVFFRLQNIFSGNDTSGKGRTFEAFILADKILDLRNHWWGIGAGQIKIIGSQIIKDFYLYTPDYTSVAIPNVTAETMALFGLIGLMLRFGVEIFFFFYTKAWTNYFRLLLFFFMFIYQLTGSFITNLAEYVIWILAFTEVFPQFHVNFSLNKNFAE